MDCGLTGGYREKQRETSWAAKWLTRCRRWYALDQPETAVRRTSSPRAAFGRLLKPGRAWSEPARRSSAPSAAAARSRVWLLRKSVANVAASLRSVAPGWANVCSTRFGARKLPVRFR